MAGAKEGSLTNAASTSPRRVAVRAIASLLISVTTAIVIAGLSVALFFNPIWVSFAQERAGVSAITGYTPEDVRRATGAILSDVIVGPPEFAVRVNGERVLGDLERSHMVDVYDVLRLAIGLLAVAVVTLILTFAVNRDRAWVWRSVFRGAAVLLAIGVAIGVAVVFFFDEAFLLFHRLFFAQGNFTFDPRTQRLVQLLPDQFWTETVMGVVGAGLVITAIVALVSRRRGAAL